MTTLEKYIWVVNALYRAGSHGLSLKELSDKWERDESISCGEPLPRQTFNRWKDNILMSLGVNIDCRLKGGYRYYISNPESLANGGLLRWLLDTYSTVNTLSQSTSLKDRILVEEIPSSRHFLTDIVDAMKGNNVIMATYRNFHYKNSYTFPIAPYCLKMFQKRWYVLALSINEDRLRIYGLDRFENIEITKDHFKFPIDFNAKDYFSSFFGVVIDEDIPLQRIVVRAFGTHQHYHALSSVASLTERALFLQRICRFRTYASSHLRLHNGVAKLWGDDRSDGTTVAKADHEMLYKRSVRIV